MRRLTASLLAALALGTLSPSAARADCKKSEKQALSVMKALDNAGALAVTLWSQCMFHGPDERQVAKLTTATRRAFATLTTLEDPAPSCIKSGDFVKAVGTLGNSAGQRLGLAWATCSPKAQARALELAAQGMAMDKIEAAIGEMGQAWLQEITK